MAATAIYDPLAAAMRERGLMSTESSVDQSEAIPLPPIVPSDHERTLMDMKHQLVLWKKASYLLDHLSLTQEFMVKLVDYGLFNRGMIDQIYAKGSSAERTLAMLTLLGQLGHDVYNKFIRILVETKHYTVAKELQKTERFTHYGEMLPPVFTYFMSLSEFLNMYPHIAIKLGEDEKHILQTFIEGKIEMATRKVNESNQVLEAKIARLKKKIADLQADIRNRIERERLLQEKLKQSQAHIEDLNTRIKLLEKEVFDWKCEVRRLKHFRHEQEELDNWILEERQEKRLKGGPIGDFGRLPTFIGNKAAKNTSSVKLKLLSAQVHMAINKLYYVQDHMQNLNYLEGRLNSFVGKPTDTFDKETLQDLHNLKTLLVDTKREKLHMMEELTEEEKEILAKEQEIQKLRQEILGKSATPDYQTEGHTSLRTKMIRLLDDIAKLHDRRIEEINVKHFKEIAKINAYISDLNYAHNKDKEALKWRMRCKMGELHRREMLHRRMKHIIMVICRYHAKNMNATITVEQCRKIVRGIIGESRKLRKMADEADALEKNPQKEPPTEEEQEKERLEREKMERQLAEKENMKAGNKKKMKRRKDVDYLKNERLMFVADRLQGDWRMLGINLGLSMNRMDIIEIEQPQNAKPDSLGLAMLKSWRDEIKGKVAIKAARLVKGLLKMGRKDLAIIVLPLHRVDLLLQEVAEEEKAEEERRQKAAAEEAELEKDTELEENDVMTSDEAAREISRDVLSLETRRHNVPILPEIHIN